MHELSIALSILDTVEEEMARLGDVILKTIHLQLGPLSGVVKVALESAFELAREGSPFPEVGLVIEEIPIRIYCEVCESEQLAESIQMLCCSRCGVLSGKIVSGRELDITALEIEDSMPR